MLNINSAEEGTCLTFMLEGKVDTSTAPELEKRIESEAADADTGLCPRCAAVVAGL